MATGERAPDKHPTGERQLAHAAPNRGPSRDLALGEVMVGTGRISAARRIMPVLPTLPFRRSQLARLDDELARANRGTGLSFSIYLGDLGTDTRARAEELLDSLGPAAADAVLVAVSPGQQVIEIITGPVARQRLDDRGCKRAVTSMAASFEQSALAEGLINGVRTLAKLTDSAP